MITASIETETGSLKREVSRAGSDRGQVSLCDEHGVIIVARLTAKGDIVVRIERPGHEPEMLGFVGRT